MTLLDDIDATTAPWTPPEPKRDQWGRYKIAGQSYTRATTIAKILEDETNLTKWKIRTAAAGLALRPDLYAMIASHPDDKKTLDAVCRDALEAAGGSSRSNLGTALHAFTGALDLGQTKTVPAAWQADVDVYRQTMMSNGVQIVNHMVERVCLLDEYQIAGTFDRLVTIPGRDLPMIADLKTGRSLDFSWGSIAIQMAIYANANSLWEEDDSLTPMPTVDGDQALIIHLPVGESKCDLYFVDIRQGLEALQRAVWTYQWRKQRKTLAVKYVPTVVADPVMVSVEPDVSTEGETVNTPAPPKPVEADTMTSGVKGKASSRTKWIKERIDLLKPNVEAMKVLAEYWPVDVPKPKKAADYNDHELDQLIVLLNDIEARFSAPFGAVDPADVPVVPASEIIARMESLSAPDEGPGAAPMAVKAAQDRYKALPKIQVEIAHRWAVEAKKEGGSISVTQNPSTRRVELAHAIQNLLDAGIVAPDDPAVYGCLVNVLGTAATDVPVGTHLARMGYIEARRLADLTAMIAADDGTVQLDFQLDGTVKVSLTGK